MASRISSGSLLRANSIGQPDLRLVSSGGVNRLAVSRASEQSAKTAVVACLTCLSPDNREVLNRASAAAREHDGEFYAVLIDSPRTRFRRPQVRAMIEEALLANSLGARIVWFDTPDFVSELLQFMRQSHIGRILVSRGRPTLFSGLFRAPVYRELLRRAKGIRIDVVGFEQGNNRTRSCEHSLRAIPV